MGEEIQIGTFRGTRQMERQGTSVLYAARSKSGELLTLCVLEQHLGGEEALAKRFEETARSLAALGHPNLLPVSEVGFHNRLAFLASPAPLGGTLRGLLQAHKGRLPSPRLVTLVATDALGALSAAASLRRPILHGGVRPESFLYDLGGGFRLAGFGLAELLSHESMQGSQFLDEVGSYQAPELLDSAQPTTATDVFCLGITLYEALAGESPFAAPTPMMAMMKVSAGKFPPLSERAPGTPAPLADLIHRMLRVEPSERPTLDDLRLELAALLDDPDAAREELRRVADKALKIDAAGLPAPSAPMSSAPPVSSVGSLLPDLDATDQELGIQPTTLPVIASPDPEDELATQAFEPHMIPPAPEGSFTGESTLDLGKRAAAGEPGTAELPGDDIDAESQTVMVRPAARAEAPRGAWGMQAPQAQPLPAPAAPAPAEPAPAAPAASPAAPRRPASKSSDQALLIYIAIGLGLLLFLMLIIVAIAAMVG